MYAMAAVRLVLPAIAGVGEALLAAKHRLAVRTWRFPELHGRWCELAAAPESETTPASLH